MHYLKLDILSCTACNPVGIVWQYDIRNLENTELKDIQR